MGTKAAIYIHPNGDGHKQQGAILSYCDQHFYVVVSISYSPESAAQAVTDGLADVVVAATDPRNGLRHLVTVAGGSVEFVRERSRAPSLREFLGRAVSRGKTPSEIARAIGSETTDISELMKRLGLRKPDDRP